MERRLALLLTILAVVCGLATYVVLSQRPPYGARVRTVLLLLNLDLVLLLGLGLIIARRLVRVIVELAAGPAGSRLHTRLVLLFSLVAVAPSVVVAVFSVFFLSSGLENWFSDRVRTALENSLAVAQAYLQEHKENIRADALAMAADLNRDSAVLDFSPQRLQQVVEFQAALRVAGRGHRVRQLAATCWHAPASASPWTLEPIAARRHRARRSRATWSTVTSDTGDRVRAARPARRASATPT